MKRVLLAIDGVFPDKGLVEYALDFSQRIKARLDVLHIVDVQRHAETAKEARKKVSRAKEYFEKAMMAAAFAESGEHATANALMKTASEQFHNLVPKEHKSDVQYQVKIRSTRVDREILNYVKGHKDIVLAIYDDAVADRANQKGRTRKPMADTNRVSRQLQQQLPVPLVIRSGAGA